LAISKSKPVPVIIILLIRPHSFSRHPHSSPTRLPETSNFGSPPAELEDFLWINETMAERFNHVANRSPAFLKENPRQNDDETELNSQL